MDNRELQNRFTEVVAKTLDIYDQQKEGIYPPMDHKRWEKRYHGIPESELPEHTIILNHFKPFVDMTVCQLMMAMDDDLWTRGKEPAFAKQG